MGGSVPAQRRDFRGHGDVRISYACWDPGRDRVLGVVQISHGMGEHIGRYARFAEQLAALGWVVYGADHRGHGLSIGAHGQPGDFGAGGFDALVDDLLGLNKLIRAKHRKVPCVLFAHSMGSFAAQQLILDHSECIDALMLSGSGALDEITHAVHEQGVAAVLQAVNAGIDPLLTPFDWLSTDPDEVAAFAQDPLCFPALTEQSAASVLAAADRLADPRALRGIRSDLPIRFLAGSEDPVGMRLRGVLLAARRYHAAGVKSVSVDVEVAARHELLNERQRDAISGRIISWFDAVGPASVKHGTDG